MKKTGDKKPKGKNKALESNESYYKHLFKNNPLPMWIYDLETLSFLEVNNSAVMNYGYSYEEFSGMTLKDIRPPEDIDRLLDDVANTTFEYNKAGIWRHIKKNGEIILVEIISHSIIYKEKKARLVIANNVTGKLKAEKELVESEQSLREAQEIAQMGNWEFDLISQKSKWSANCYRLYGYEPNEFEPTYELFRSLIHPDDLLQIDKGYESIIQKKQPIDIEIRIKQPNKTYKWILNRIIPVFEGDQLIKLKGVNIDINDKKKNELELKLLNKFVEQSPITVVITNIEGKIEYVNANFTKTTGYSFDEAIGKNPRVLKSGYHDDSFFKQLWNTILSGKSWTGEILNKKKDGELYWESAIISPIVNSKGVISHFVAAKEDITRKKALLAELVIAKEKAEESDRLKSAFLANISHEIRTPMNGILGFLNLINDHDINDETKGEYIEIVNMNAERLLNTVNDIIEISKLEANSVDVKYSEVNILELMEARYEYFKHQVNQKGLKFNFSPQIKGTSVKIHTDKYKLESIFDNLIKNAIKFTSNGFIEIGSYIENGFMVFYFKDSGKGIPADRLGAIFNHFIQADLKISRAHEGAGLGLSIVKSYVKLLNGEIKVESKIGEGSTFKIYLPCNNAK